MNKKLAAVLVVGSLMVIAGLLAHVNAAAPAAEFSFSPSNPDINTEVLFDAKNSGSSISLYEWDFDGDGKYEVSSQSALISHLFDTSGSQSVNLRVTDSRGAQQSVSEPITIKSASVMIRREITTPMDPNRVAAGSTFQVKVTVHFLEDVTAPGLDENFPTNWRVTSVDHGNALFKSSETAWLMTSVVSAGTTWEVNYNVTVPSSTTSGIYEIYGLFTSRSISKPLQIEVPGDHFVRVI